jgi:hypothetical protein
VSWSQFKGKCDSPKYFEQYVNLTLEVFYNKYSWWRLLAAVLRREKHWRKMFAPMFDLVFLGT